MWNPDARLRLVTPADAVAVAVIYAAIVESTGISFEEVAPGADLMRVRIEETTRMYPWLVFEEAGRVAGFAYSYAHRERAAYRWSVDVSVYLAESARGRGVGTKLYSALLRILEARGFRRVFAGIALPNDASIALHTALGFMPVGVYHDVGYKLGAWRGVAWFERPLTETDSAPDEPIPLPRLAAPILAEALSL